MLKKYLLLTLGTLALGLGVVGLFLPVLPTTPLLLTAAYCYLRSSPSLVNHRLLGRGLKDYLERRVVPRRAKVVALSTLWQSLLIAMLLIPLPAVRLFLPWWAWRLVTISSG